MEILAQRKFLISVNESFFRVIRSMIYKSREYYLPIYCQFIFEWYYIKREEILFLVRVQIVRFCSMKISWEKKFVNVANQSFFHVSSNSVYYCKNCGYYVSIILFPKNMKRAGILFFTRLWTVQFSLMGNPRRRKLENIENKIFILMIY